MRHLNSIWKIVLEITYEPWKLFLERECRCSSIILPHSVTIGLYFYSVFLSVVDEGIYKAGERSEMLGAVEVQEDEDTRVEVPVDQVLWEEVHLVHLVLFSFLPPVSFPCVFFQGACFKFFFFSGTLPCSKSSLCNPQIYPNAAQFSENCYCTRKIQSVWWAALYYFQNLCFRLYLGFVYPWSGLLSRNTTRAVLANPSIGDSLNFRRYFSSQWWGTMQ